MAQCAATAVRNHPHPNAQAVQYMTSGFPYPAGAASAAPAVSAAPSAPLHRALDARLLAELRRQRLPTPAAPAAAQDRVALYRSAIAQLDAKVALGNGHPPMQAMELQLLCRCALSCRTLAEALACARDFCAMLTPRAGRLSLQIEGDQATFHMDSLRTHSSSASCLVDLTGLFCYLALWGWLIGQPLRPQHVFAAHHSREDAAPLLGLFVVPVHLGQRTYGFTFDAALLQCPVVRQPHELPAFVADFPFALMAAHTPGAGLPLVQQVRQQLDAALAHQLPLPGLAELAPILGLSAATLRRRLAAEGHSYLQLRQASCCDAAQRSLHGSHATITDIALQLGFGSAAAFRRAFVQWCGTSPSAYRAQCRSDAASPQGL